MSENSVQRGGPRRTWSGINLVRGLILALVWALTLAIVASLGWLTHQRWASELPADFRMWTWSEKIELLGATSNESRRDKASACIGEGFGEPDPAHFDGVPYLVKLLGHANPRVRGHAISLLGWLYLSSQSRYARDVEPAAQERAKAARETVVNGLLKLQRDPAVEVRRRLAGALQDFVEVRGTSQALAGLARDPDGEVRISALQSMTYCEKADLRVLLPLAERLAARDPEDRVRSSAQLAVRLMQNRLAQRERGIQTEGQ